jgi:NAD(P)H-dependent FMN reductase
MRWLGVVGSLRKDSWNRHLLVALAERMPDGSSLDVRGIEGIPVYDGDLEAAAFPEVVVALQEAIAQADGVVLASPEYN